MKRKNEEKHETPEPQRTHSTLGLCHSLTIFLNHGDLTFMASRQKNKPTKRKKPSLGAELFSYVQQRAHLLNNPCAEISSLKRKLKALLHLEKSSLKKVKH